MFGNRRIEIYRLSAETASPLEAAEVTKIGDGAQQ
jgi:hypothetical protein